MTALQIWIAGTFLAIVAFCWLYYFGRDIQRWWRERGPRRQMAQEAAQQRRDELARLRDELANKYLPPGVGTPPASES